MARILVLVLWYGAWIAVGVLASRPGVVGMVLALGAGVVAYLLTEVFAGGGISGPHLIAAVFVTGISFGIARVVGLMLAAGAV
ncbi:hypothetical protein [Rhodobium gokarnense]|uniref:Uncharacterized protein n=1 Tax=Rhodobium gokarnense TaxID=364296 RepID=A0ABT3HD01_9HYPH|nr:hypothetical protein [Rhodobium gokarnense]MCW2308271.1 hypothetical protein [Rhodobium gokarnense]